MAAGATGSVKTEESIASSGIATITFSCRFKPSNSSSTSEVLLDLLCLTNVVGDGALEGIGVEVEGKVLLDSLKLESLDICDLKDRKPEGSSSSMEFCRCCS